VVSSIGRINARELAPEVVAALDDPLARQGVIRLLARWKVEAAREPLEKIVRNAVEEKVDIPENAPKAAIEYVAGRQLISGVDAAGALVILGKDTAWNDLRHFATSKHKDVRIELIDLLPELRDPRSVDLLIGLVKDTEEHHLYRGGQLGDAAAASLKKLTGENFGRDAARWAAWWKERGGKLPERR
jgi:HEAT repeat protein